MSRRLGRLVGSFERGGRGGLDGGGGGGDVAGQEPFEAADDFALRESFGGAPVDVVDGGLVPAHADDDGAVEGGVGLPVASSVEAVPSVGLAGAGRDGAGAAHLRERCFRLDAG